MSDEKITRAGKTPTSGRCCAGCVFWNETAPAFEETGEGGASSCDGVCENEESVNFNRPRAPQDTCRKFKREE